MSEDLAIRDTIVALLRQRDVSASICPSEVARELHSNEEDWRAAMPEVRRVVAALACTGVVRVTQRDRDVPASDVENVSGPVRLRRGRAFTGA